MSQGRLERVLARCGKDEEKMCAALDEPTATDPRAALGHRPVFRSVAPLVSFV
jgi:hypothetical protein